MTEPYIVRDDFFVSDDSRRGEYAPEVAVLANGNFVAVWSSGNIIGKLFDGAGTELRQFELTKAGQAGHATIAPLSDGGFAIAFADANFDSTATPRYSSVLRAGVFDENAVARTAIVPISDQPLFLEFAPAVAEFENGNLAIGWQRGQNFVGPDSDATGYLKIVDQGLNTVLPTTEITEMSRPFDPSEYDMALLALPNGNVVASWNSDDEMMFKIFDQDGALVKDSTGIQDIGYSGQGPELVALSDGGFAAAYVDSSFGSGIRVATFTSAGEAQVEPILVPELDGAGQPQFTKLIAEDDGGFTVFWSVDFAPRDGQVFAQRYNSDGTTNGDVFAVSTLQDVQQDSFGFSNFEGVFDVARGPDGTTFVIWENEDNQIRAKIYDTNGPEVALNRAAVFQIAEPSFDIPENVQDITVLSARDLDGDTVSFSIEGGGDAARFIVDPVSGLLSFAANPDFEAPADFDGDNEYQVVVGATDGMGGTDLRTLSVSIDEISEGEPGGPQPEDYDRVFNDTRVSNGTFIDDLDSSLSGLESDDWIDARAGSDRIDGGAGNDYIIAGAGSDFDVRGGDGADIFQLRKGDEVIRIKDFEIGIDKLHLVGGLTFDDLQISEFTNGDGLNVVKMTTSSGDIFNLEGVAPGAFSAADIWQPGDAEPFNRAPILDTEQPRGILENSTTSSSWISATDSNGDGLTFSITGGADAALLSYSTEFFSSELIFNTEQDFEAPSDANGDGLYEVEITVEDGRGGTDVETFQIALLDVFEASDFTPPPISSYDTQIFGTPLADVLVGTDGDDYIDAGDGADSIDAGAGDDYIIAGRGDDYNVSGGAGADLFQYTRVRLEEDSRPSRSGDQILRILDFEPGVDKVVLMPGTVLSDFRVTEFEGTTTYGSGSVRIIFEGLSADEIGAEDFLSATAAPAGSENSAPVLSGPDGEAFGEIRLSIEDGQSTIGTLSAFDADEDELTYVLDPENRFEESQYFEFDPVTLALSLNFVPDYFDPVDIGDRVPNELRSELQVSDGVGGFDSAFITVEIQPAGSDVVYPENRNIDQTYITIPSSDGATISGGSGDDFIPTGGGSDTLFGLGGNDWLLAGPGDDDRATGGPGADIFEVRGGDGTLTITDFEDGIDQILVRYGLRFADLEITSTGTTANPETTILGPTGERIILQDISGDQITVADFLGEDVPSDPVEPPVVDDGETITGTDAQDRITGTDAGERIEALGGNDIINAGGGDDYIVAGAGFDYSVAGGAGADVFEIGVGDQTVRILDFEDGVDLLNLTGGLALEDLRISENVSGGVTTTNLRSESGERIMLVGLEADQITEDDLYTEGSGGGAPQRSDYASVLEGSDARDVLIGNDSDEWIEGLADNDVIRGNGGDDYIVAGSGLDYSVSGGNGADISEIGAGDQTVRILDFEDGVDLLHLTGGLALGDLSVSENVADGVTTTNLRSAGGERIMLVGIEADQITQAYILSVVAPVGDSPQPEDYDAELYGDAGDNPLQGSGLAEWISGGDGNDKINAGAGDDYIIAGSGRDGFVRGGAGTDIFEFGAGDQEIFIFDFELGLDQIALRDGLEFSDLAQSDTEFNGITSALFVTEDGDRLKLRDVSVTDLSVDDFLLI